MRIQDCKEELHNLLLEDVRIFGYLAFSEIHALLKRLSGASLLVLANKQDIQGSMSDQEIRDVCSDILHEPDFDHSCHLQLLDLPGIKSHRWKIWPCSAITGQNLVAGLDWIVHDVAHRLYYSSTAGSIAGTATA